MTTTRRPIREIRETVRETELTESLARGKRQRVANGIYADRYGLEAIVTVGPAREAGRFPLGTNLDDIEAWRLETRARLIKARGIVGPAGTLASDIAIFLEALPAGPTRAGYEQLLRHWRNS